MKRIKRFGGLLKEDLKNKLWLVLITWYAFGMFCFLFATKATIPAGEVRSLYVGAGNTSFFAAMLVLGFLMGITAFPYLYSGKKADLYFSLPFSRTQMFLAGCINDFLIFSFPMVICKLIFFKLSVSMGYCKYEEAVLPVWIGCGVMVLGWLFIRGLSMLSALLTRNTGYTLGVFILFLLGPDLGFRLTEKMMKICIPTFYRSEMSERLSGFFSPMALLKNAAGVDEYADGALWSLQDHLPYIFFLGAAVLLLLVLNCLVFRKRPVERGRRMFSFRFAECFVRYACVLLAVLWIVSSLQIFTWGGFSAGLAVFSILWGVPLVHGLLNVLLSFNMKRFFSGKWHLLAEYLLMFAVTGIFVFGGKKGGAFPAKEETESLAVVLNALGSGDEPEEVLSHMDLTGEELSFAWDWIEAYCLNAESLSGPEAESFDLLIKCRLKDGREKYYRYEIPQFFMDAFGDIFNGEGFKEGTYAALRLDSLKYYEIRWSNGMETYTLDLSREERQKLWEIYKEDFMGLTFSDIRKQTPIGSFTFCETRRHEEVTGYIYPGFTGVLKALSEYGIDGGKTIKDYPVNKIVIDKYLVTEGLLYDVRYLKWKKEITDEETIAGLTAGLCPKDFCGDYLLNNRDVSMEITLYYQDSLGKTVNSIPCMADGETDIR